MAAPKSYSHLVVIGSSAGGIEALSAVVSKLPTDFRAPIVIAQHLDPSRPSHLGDILSRRSTLPVRTVNEPGLEALEPGVVYVVPSNRDVHIDDSSIELQIDSTGRPKPSIDLLLTSASDTYGDRLIAVILSGTGSDGAAGARAVKKAGGTVLIQNPDTASYPGMPLSLAPTTVDIIANLDRIGPILHDLLAGIEVPTQPTERKELETFLAEIRERFDIDFSSYKTPTILRRLQRRIIATDTENLKGYIEYLDTHPGEYQQLVNAFLIKVTDFFRDPDLFAYLRTEILPELIAEARKQGSELRIWSAGCATGEEAYSLAILMAEVLGTELDTLSVRIFATDVDADAVAFARRGIYAASALSSVSEDLINRYFTRDDGNYIIRKRVRALTVFGQHDLGQRAPFPHIDLIMCRNVLIYFTPELQQRTLKLFAYSLRDGGYLVLGKAESTGSMGEYFALQHKQHKVYRRQGERILMPPARIKEPMQAPPHRLGPRRSPPSLLASLAGDRERQRTQGLSEAFLLKLPVGVVVIDRRYDIQAINTAARRLLSIHGAAIGEDLLHSAQGVPQQQLRAAIDSAFREGAPTGIEEFAVEEVTTGDPRYLQISCHPQREEGSQGPVDDIMVIVHDVTHLVQTRRDLEQRLESTRAELQHTRGDVEAESARREQLIQRLVDTNRQLVDANQELTSTNEELRATNEEFMLSTEEAQAATEEVETLNEELQATNEELETLNEELQATIEELNTTNDDLHARSVELQELARASEEERARLAAILASIGDAVVVVGSNGTPLLTNAAYEHMFGGTPLEPQDEEGQLLPPEQSPLARAARGESFSMEFTLAGRDDTRRWFEANGQPIHDPEGMQQGAVVVVRDMTDRSLHQMQEEFLARVSHELRTPMTPISAYLQQLIRTLGDAPREAPARRYAESALGQVQRLARLVEDLLDVSRMQAGKYTLNRAPVLLDEITAQTVEMAQLMTQGQTIYLEHHDGPLPVQGDADRLQQVLLNLLINAIKYAPNSKRIDVRLRRVGDEAELQVQDHGPGIPAADVAHLFTRFYQARRTNGERGLGLGLYIAHEIVTTHGGRIEVNSTEGKGATFTIRLPLLADEGKRGGTGKR
jgi:two-component system CheB/CheR fusion protein